MRRQYRRRSYFGMAVWTLVLVVPTGLTAWKFEWFPLDSAIAEEEAVEPGDEVEEQVDPQRTLAAFDNKQGVDPIVFSGQSEPQYEEDTGRPVDAELFSVDQIESPRPLGRPYPARERVRRSASSEFDRETAVQMRDPRVRTSAFTENQSGRELEQTSDENVEPPQNIEPTGPDLTAIDRWIEAGKTLEAHRALSKMYWSNPEWREIIRSRIEQTAESIFFTPFPHYVEPYVIQPGDQLRLVARNYNVPWQYLAKLNRIEPQRIREGQRLKVIQGPFAAVVDLSDFEMTLHTRGYFVCTYPVGIGKDNSTPVGTFKVQNKVVNPQYTAPDGAVVDADDPTNPLGERWIDLGGSYGIHGTIEPDSIGRAASRGCIRLRDTDINDAFDLLSIGSEVVVRP